MADTEENPGLEASADPPRYESVRASYGLLESYYGDGGTRKSLVADIEDRIRREIRENKIQTEIPRNLIARKRFMLPVLILPVLLLLVFLSLVVTRRLFSNSIPDMERDALEYGSTEGYILDILRRESEKKLDRSDAAVSRYLNELEEIEAQRVLLVSEFAFSLVFRAEELNTKLETRLEESRTALKESHGEDTAAFRDSLAIRRAALLKERNQDYDRFRRIRLALFEKEQGEILERRQNLEREVTRELLSESAAGIAGSNSMMPSPLEIPAVAMPRPLFSLPPAVRESVELGLEEKAVNGVEEILTEIYPDNAEYRAVLRVARLAAQRAAAQAAIDAGRAMDKAVRYEIGQRVAAFLEALEREPLLSDRRIEALAENHGGGDPVVSSTMVSIARALRTAGANAPETNLSFLGILSIHAGDRIVIELSGGDPPAPGARILVRRRTEDGGEMPVASGAVVAVFGRSVEARIEELYDDRVRPMLMDRVYIGGP